MRIRAQALVATLLAIVASAGCGSSQPSDRNPPPLSPLPPPTLPVPLPRGLRRAWRIVVEGSGTGTPHATRMVQHPAVPSDVFVSNSFGGFMRYRVTPVGARLLFSSAQPADGSLLYCNRLAFHAASDTVYCVGLMGSVIGLFDGTTGARRGTAADGGKYQAGFRDAVVHGGGLYLAGVHRGLLRRAVAPDGSLGAAERVIEGTITGVAETDGAVIALERGRGLVLVPDGGPSERVSLPGPPLEARVRGGRAVVALGSQGVALVDLSTREVRHLVTGCMTGSADVGEGVLVAGCRQGLRVFTLPATGGLGPPTGSARAVYSEADVMVRGSDLLSLDWWMLSRFELDGAEGDPLDVDVPQGWTIAPGASLRFEVHNPFDVPRQAGDTLVPPRSRAWITEGQTSEERSLEMGSDSARRRGEVTLTIAPVLDGRAALGQPLPLSMPGSRVYVLQADCALQWPEVEDLLWLRDHGGFGDGRPIEVLLLVDQNSDFDWYRAAWAPLTLPAVGALAALAVPPISYSEILRRLDIRRLLLGPDNALFVTTDAANRVTELSSIYRGTHGLAVELLAPVGGR
ncbi:MAG: hypothetical protein Q8S73_05155 [Deltaproteobacteria bacterium]|nr:hypothetical protein [Myxococcales bacterium]MDP3213468.1 hypothetical protein [Deltaproteobacteria bacterium]